MARGRGTSVIEGWRKANSPRAESRAVQQAGMLGAPKTYFLSSCPSLVTDWKEVTAAKSYSQYQNGTLPLVGRNEKGRQEGQELGL